VTHPEPEKVMDMRRKFISLL